jgi:hypothetical protein
LDGESILPAKTIFVPLFPPKNAFTYSRATL